MITAIIWGLVITAIGGGILAFYCDFCDWNYGVCKESGQPWQSFSVDSSGAIGYRDDCGHTIWISYPVIRLANYINKLRK
ncbi:hypothetical protein D3C75_584130 [compost metagenome]